jgi:hypothetical protein
MKWPPKLLSSERLTVALIAAVTLSGCDEGQNPPEPRSICTQVTGTYSCGRGGTCEQCGNWQIGCPRPLELQEKDDGTLICRLQKKPDTCLLTKDGCQ